MSYELDVRSGVPGVATWGLRAEGHARDRLSALRPQPAAASVPARQTSGEAHPATLTTMDEERIGLFIDYENLAIGARQDLGMQFDFKPIAGALAERGRVVVRRAYADWTLFEGDRRMLAESHVEMIEIPQRKGAVRKNAADIKMAVDAIELAFEREYVTTFVICTGDSDFTPLVHKLRELNKKVVGVGLKASTSALLPAACDEFLFYERLDGVEVPARSRRRKSSDEETSADDRSESSDIDQVVALLTQTLGGLQRSAGGPIRSSSLKRALLRKDSTFSEADYGFRAFGELLHHLQDLGVLELSDEGSRGDPVVDFAATGEDVAAFALLRDVVGDLQGANGPPAMSGLKNQLRKRSRGFSERRFGYSGFLQFVKAAHARGFVDFEWSDEDGDYRVSVPG
jgi:uncharacterized protein (TIGR00288 family)